VTFYRTALRVVAAVVLLAGLVVVGVGARVWWVARGDDRRASDAILVLGASQYDGRPSPVFQARLAHAADLWRAKVATHVVTVGGGQPGDRTTEADAGKAWLVSHGVPADDVVAVPTGSNTLESVRAAEKAMSAQSWKTAVVVTDPWHCLRARTMAHDAGIDAVTSPARSGPAVRTRGVELRYIGRETGAYLSYKLFHRSVERGPGAV
jgi:uncharacterized SAM-binding protein YcdF (DUF218 family)